MTGHLAKPGHGPKVSSIVWTCGASHNYQKFIINVASCHFRLSKIALTIDFGDPGREETITWFLWSFCAEHFVLLISKALYFLDITCRKSAPNGRSRSSWSQEYNEKIFNTMRFHLITTEGNYPTNRFSLLYGPFSLGLGRSETGGIGAFPTELWEISHLISISFRYHPLTWGFELLGKV